MSFLWIIFALVAVAVIIAARGIAKATPDVTRAITQLAGLAPWPFASADLGRDERSMTAPAVTFTSSKPLSSLKIGDVAQITINVGGKPITSGVVQWAMSKVGVVKCAPLMSYPAPGTVAQLTALAAGSTLIICVVNGIFSAIQTASVAAVPVPIPVPPPVPTPPRNAPAKDWKRHRDSLTIMRTDFNYNWDSAHDSTASDPTPMEKIVAARYDVVIGGVAARVARIKKANPNFRAIPYALELTTLTNVGGTPNISTVYLNDFAAYCAAHNVSAADAEAAWLHEPGYSDAVHRLAMTIWNSPRNVPDPTSPLMRAYTVDRFKRIAAPATADGVFIDEYGSSMLNSYKRSAGTDAARLTALGAAQTSLLDEIAAAMYPKQLIINTGAYMFPWDAATTHAARGAHLEQLNTPMMAELWGNVWPYIDSRLAAGDFVNLVPLYDFGHYEYLHDSQRTPTSTPVAVNEHANWTHHPTRSALNNVQKATAPAASAPIPGANYMDTLRGKLLELVSAYMVVTDPALLGLSIENGDWGKFTPSQNWLPQIDVDLGRAIEKRVRLSSPSGSGNGVCFQRRFQKGLVVANMLQHDDYAGPQNFGIGNATSIVLPTDRAYYFVKADGTIDTIARKSITLRSPEAAIFVTSPTPTLDAPEYHLAPDVSRD